MNAKKVVKTTVTVTIEMKPHEVKELITYLTAARVALPLKCGFAHVGAYEAGTLETALREAK